MAAKRAESFRLALLALRERLREGCFAPGERIAAVEVAEALRLSATPVREALSRLAGEGLIEERRGQGYFIRTLSALDVADLYRLSLSHLAIALDAHRLGRQAQVQALDAWAGDPVADVERLFQGWVREAGGRALSLSYRTLEIRLGPVRRAEPLLFTDLAEEAGELRAVARDPEANGRLKSLRRFHDRRLGVADRIASLLEGARAGGEV